MVISPFCSRIADGWCLNWELPYDSYRRYDPHGVTTGILGLAGTSKDLTARAAPAVRFLDGKKEPVGSRAGSRPSAKKVVRRSLCPYLSSLGFTILNTVAAIAPPAKLATR